MRAPSLLTLLVLVAGCVRDAGLGPDVGACAVYPDGAYTFGEPGIGTCLAAPSWLDFHTAGGRSLLAVTNADPFRTYASGSLLEIDADALAEARGVVSTAEIEAWSLPMERFVGGFAFANDGDLAVIASRFSEGSYLRRVDDRVWFVDVSDPTQPRYLSQRYLSVGADPFATVADPDAGRVYVVNATDVSVSVLDTTGPVPDLFDVAGEAIVTRPVLTRVPGSIGVAELDVEAIDRRSIRTTQAWTATWVDGTYRIWVPEEIEPGVEGLARWTSGGRGYFPVAFGVEVDPTGFGVVATVEDPWVGLGGDGLSMHFSDGRDIRLAATDGSAGNWGFLASPVLEGGDGWRAFLGGPSILDVNGTSTLFFHARATDDGDAVIGRAVSREGGFRADASPVLTPPAPFRSLEQPSVLLDRNTRGLRMWASALGPDGWSIVHAASSDRGTTWSTPEVVLALDDAEVGAPYVTWTGGRYLMWLAVNDGEGWYHATSWSWDGYTWAEPVFAAPSDRPADARPPRAGVQPAPTEAWRLEGADVGVLNQLVPAGVTATLTTSGFVLEAAQGHVTGTEAVRRAEGGLLPGSIAEVDGEPVLYATAFREASPGGGAGTGRPRLVALRRDGDGWMGLADDLIPDGAGGNVDGATSPVVFFRNSRWHLLYGAVDGDVVRLRRAVSDDGLHFRPQGGLVLPDPPAWASVQQLPHGLLEEDGALLLFLGGFDGSRWRIGTLRSTDGTTWTPTGDDGLILGPGDPGTFDDSGVRDPTVVRDGDRVLMWYAGFDGEVWSVGQAVRQDGTWVRRRAPLTNVAEAVLPGVARSFSDEGTLSPVAVLDPALPARNGAGFTLWYGGSDGSTFRIGRARAWNGETYPEHRFPTAGDTFSFLARRGEAGRSSIRLGQVIEGFSLPGAPNTTFREGPGTAVLDPDAGMLYVGSVDWPGVIVVDVRDDSDADFDDVNYLDIEAVLRFDTTTNQLGVSAMVRDPATGRIYLGVREPDAVLVLDPAGLVVDDAEKQMIDFVSVGVLPMHDETDDDGDETFAALGVAGLALVPSQQLLLVSHFRDNSVSVFDLRLGAFGEEIRHIEDVGENPHAIAVSPDQTWAVVACFLGATPSGADGSTLAVIDLDPDSPTYLQVRARVVNQ